MALPRRQDPDVKQMTPAQLRAEVMKLRREIFRLVSAEENNRCWLNDRRLAIQTLPPEIYAEFLPEDTYCGRMDLPEDVLLRNCRRYIRRQQCHLHGCTHPVSFSPGKST